MTLLFVWIGFFSGLFLFSRRLGSSWNTHYFGYLQCCRWLVNMWTKVFFLTLSNSALMRDGSCFSGAEWGKKPLREIWDWTRGDFSACSVVHCSCILVFSPSVSASAVKFWYAINCLPPRCQEDKHLLHVTPWVVIPLCLGHKLSLAQCFTAGFRYV